MKGLIVIGILASTAIIVLAAILIQAVAKPPEDIKTSKEMSTISGSVRNNT